MNRTKNQIKSYVQKYIWWKIKSLKIRNSSIIRKKKRGIISFYLFWIVIINLRWLFVCVPHTRNECGIFYSFNLRWKFKVGITQCKANPVWAASNEHSHKHGINSIFLFTFSSRFSIFFFFSLLGVVEYMKGQGRAKYLLRRSIIVYTHTRIKQVHS